MVKKLGPLSGLKPKVISSTPQKLDKCPKCGRQLILHINGEKRTLECVGIYRAYSIAASDGDGIKQDLISVCDYRT